jgi:hypothetical protein
VLREDAQKEAKKILKIKNINKLPLLRERNPWGKNRWSSSMHSLLDSDKIDYYIANQMPIEELYNEQASKYSKNNGDKDL